jgi:hypothetical protein
MRKGQKNKSYKDPITKELVQICQSHIMAPIHHKPNLHDMLLEWSKHSEVKDQNGYTRKCHPRRPCKNPRSPLYVQANKGTKQVKERRASIPSFKN